MCWLFFCGQPMCVFLCVYLFVFMSFCECISLWVWRWERPGLVWMQCTITVSVHVCMASPVADVVQTWTIARDCCLHIYLHDYVCVYLYVCVCVCVCVRDCVSVSRLGWGFSQINIRRLSNKNHLSCRWKHVSVSLFAFSWSYVQAGVYSCVYVCVLAVVESTQKQLRQQTWQTAGNHILLHISHALALQANTAMLPSLWSSKPALLEYHQQHCSCSMSVCDICVQLIEPFLINTCSTILTPSKMRSEVWVNNAPGASSESVLKDTTL